MKKTISLLLILVLTLCLCACGNETEKSLPETTKAAEKKISLKAFYGCWKFEDNEQYIFINENKTWELRDKDMNILSEGNYSVKNDSLVLKQEDNSTLFTLKQDGSKWLADDDGRTLARYEWNDPDEADNDISPFLGKWKYDDIDQLVIEISADGTWTMHELDTDAKTVGPCRMEYGQLILENEVGGQVLRMSLGSDDRLYDSEGDALAPYNEYDAPAKPKEDNTPWFVDHDLLVNYSLGDPAKNVVGAASVRGKDSLSYTRIPSTWFVERKSYQPTGDGNCIITLTASAMTDGSTMPSFVYKEGYVVTWSWNLCDYYSGVILTEGEEDRFYSYTYESNGEPVHVEFSYTHNYTKFDDLSYLLELTLTVRMPENYDGLVLVCYNAPESEEVQQEHDLIYEGQIILPVDELPGWREMLTGLICRINE